MIPFAAGARNEPLQGGTNGFQIDGASNGENVYLIDGVNTTNIQNGGVGKSFQMDFVEEVQIKSSSFEAEYGGALGGVINAIGKRGSNDWHGSLVTYLQTNALNANNGDRALRLNPATATNTTTRLDGSPEYFSAKKDYNTIVEPGYVVGGAILKNKLWIFSSYIPSVNTTRRTTNFTGANPGNQDSDTDCDAAQRVQSPGLRRDQQSPSVRLVELRLFPHHRPARRPGQQHSRTAQYRRFHRPQHASAPMPVRVNPLVRLQLRRRLDSDGQARGQRPLRILLQQQRTARHTAGIALRLFAGRVPPPRPI